MSYHKLFFLLAISCLWSATNVAGQEAGNQDSPIQPCAKNPWYWEYHGEPILLRGGSDEDNPFQWTGKQLTDHLDLLASTGGNYMRNTMSSRDAGNVKPFKQTADGAYDLTRWNDEYWERLEFFLKETARRGIIVQLTLWDRFDHRGRDPWSGDYNINYSREVIASERDFYNTLASSNQEGLDYQHKYIDKLLETTLACDNVLYNIDNESSQSTAWENYWANYVHRAAESMNRKVYVTTMRFDPSDAVRATMTYRDCFQFVEISQNNQDSRGGRGVGHYDNVISWRQKLAGSSDGPKPMNNEKIYGATDGSTNLSAGTETEAINRFWRNVFAGCASARFHRPASPEKRWGSGLNERVQLNLRAMTMLLSEFDLYSAAPHNDLLRHIVSRAPSSMEGYVLANIGHQYAVYFPQGRYMFGLDPWTYVDRLSIRWLNIEALSWSNLEIVEVQWEGGRDEWGDRGLIVLQTPGNESYVALIDVVESELRTSRQSMESQTNDDNH